MLSLAIVYAGVALLAPLFALAERRWPERASPHRLRALDVAYWLVVTPIVTGVLTRGATMGALGVTAYAVASSDPQTFLARLHAASPLGGLPFAAQLGLALLVADVVGYFSHRIRHRGVFWWFHAIHHSATTLDAQAAARMHPIDDMLDNVLVGGAVLAMGLSPEVFLALGPIILLHTLLTHANVAWDFGPLRWVLVSPAFHRWHHALDRAGARGCNYAGMFSFVDLLGGTFHLPRAEAPEAFGSGEAIPETVLGQLAWPWRALGRSLKARG
ncbi:MAG: sterol desaturase family protein [Sandaracinaceae bacterium]|nr:sterol desaturase family protein [Sandaracinaceae bacterium]